MAWTMCHKRYRDPSYETKSVSYVYCENHKDIRIRHVTPNEKYQLILKGKIQGKRTQDR